MDCPNCGEIIHGEYVYAQGTHNHATCRACGAEVCLTNNEVLRRPQLQMNVNYRDAERRVARMRVPKLSSKPPKYPF